MNLKWQFLSCPYPCTDDTVLSKNPTTALCMLTPLYSHYTLLHVSVHKGTYPGSTVIFCEKGQQNKRSILQPEDGPHTGPKHVVVSPMY